jgi:hypothetical protein
MSKIGSAALKFWPAVFVVLSRLSWSYSPVQLRRIVLESPELLKGTTVDFRPCRVDFVLDSTETDHFPHFFFLSGRAMSDAGLFYLLLYKKYEPTTLNSPSSDTLTGTALLELLSSIHA